MWTTHPEFQEVVKKSWARKVYGSPIFVVQQILRNVKADLKVWNWSTFENVNDRVKNARMEYDNAVDDPATKDNWAIIIEKKKTYEMELVIEEMLLREKSRDLASSGR